MFKLVIQDDEGKTTVVPLIRDEITIGRKEGNTIRLTERNVSRRHARILRNNGEVHIEDLGSYNGIRVNNARIAERVSLRVSDQVQIGDYKLYLKAEGVEQVDDARTMPIERVDTNNTATEVMAAVPPASVPSASTPPPLASSALATPATGSQLVGNPNRTMVAIADTDPQGRPVATGVTAAAVAALSAPVGYGKLVVVSSNFAGKEYELSRPQMIVGRTDENDIVVNHRSISRNHAKLVREPDTGRYTISDLQSSNGVRVNGQDYGKVELRRGDVVDLGHVRLRFVEPGEDFVFSRDAVITDVPDSGSKKGLLVAIVLGVIVLGAVGAFFMFKGNGNEEKVVKPTGSDHTGLDGQTNGTDMAAVGSNPVNPVVVDTTPDAAPPPTVPTDDAGKAIYTRCVELQNKKKWGELQSCANDLKPHDGTTADKLLAKKAAAEGKAEMVAGRLKDSRNLREAAGFLAHIPDDSVYYAESKGAYDKLERSQSDSAHARLQALAEQHNCKRFASLIEELKPTGLTNPAGDLHCEPLVAEHPPDHPPDHPKPPDHPHDPNAGSNTVVIPPPQPACNAAALKAQGDSEYSAGSYPQAMLNFKKAYDCGKDSMVLARAYQSACKANQFAEARVLFHQLPQVQQSNAQLIQICLAFQFDPRK